MAAAATLQQIIHGTAFLIAGKYDIGGGNVLLHGSVPEQTNVECLKVGKIDLTYIKVQYQAPES